MNPNPKLLCNNGNAVARQLFFASLTICFIVSGSIYSNGQSLPKVIPPSPETQSLFRYVDYPVDYSSGLPEVSIPLYEITSGSITFPISLSYHMSGRRLSDETGAVGLGWTLNCGGMISRTIYGKPDDQSVFPPTWQQAHQITASLEDYDYVKSLELPTGNDSEYDIFSYSVAGLSGKFILDRNKNVVLIPPKPVKVASGVPFPNKITDEKGNTYEFNVSEDFQQFAGGSVSTGFHISRIVSANGLDTIEFKYKGFNKTAPTHTENYRVSDYFEMAPGLDPAEANAWKSSLISGDFLKQNTELREYRVQRCTEIKFREGIVKFVLDGSTDIVKRIEIWTSFGKLVKQIEFSLYMIDTGAAPIKKLDNVLFKDIGGGDAGKFSFEYYSTVSNVDRGKDFWGYNNASSGGHLIPNYTITSDGVDRQIGNGGNRTSSESYLKAGVLKKVKYPTGGSTEFVMEANVTANAGQEVPCGGLRLKEMKTDDGAGNTQIKTFEYNTPGYLPIFPHMRFFGSQVLMFPWIDWAISLDKFNWCSQRTYYSEAQNGLDGLLTQPIFYEKVTEYHGTKAINNGKIVYHYDYGYPGNFTQIQSPLNYLQVHNRVGASIFGSGSLPYVDQSLIPHHVHDINLWNDRQLTSKTYYRNTGATQEELRYQPIKEEASGYETNTLGEHLGLHFYKMTVIPPVNNNHQYDYNERQVVSLFGMPIFYTADYKISVGDKKLQGTSERWFLNEQTLSSGVLYSYNSRGLVSKEERTLSNGKKETKEIKYPFDFLSEPVYAQMVSRNMLDYPIEITTKVDNVPVEVVKTAYKDWSGMILPEIEYRAQGTNPLETRILFKSYNATGALTQVSKTDDFNQVYLYSYQNVLPIASIKNADMSIVVQVLGGQNAIDAFASLANPSDAQIDSFLSPLRTDPSLNDATILSYTYAPLQGVTSVSDANGRKKYYTYDRAGRLEFQKDDNQFILKHYQYNYK
jgi:hypothetical protein